MDLIQKREYYNRLFDFYQPILTEKQQEYFKEYYFDDLSLSEVALNNLVSRNAVYDQLQKVLSILDYYEEKLGLYQKYLFRSKIYQEYFDDENEKIKQMLQKLKEIE